VKSNGPICNVHAPREPRPFPQRQIIKDISLSFFSRRQIGLLGLNARAIHRAAHHGRRGQGIRGEVQAPADISIGYLPQEPQLDPDKTCARKWNPRSRGVPRRRNSTKCMRPMPRRMPIRRAGRQQARLEAVIAASGSDAEHQLEIAADALRLPPWDAVIKNLSGGEKRRVALCKLLLEKPDMLLLDEPTNHLDADRWNGWSNSWVRFPGTVVAVTHDRYFLDNAGRMDTRTGSRPRHPVEGQLLELAGTERRAPGDRAETTRCPRESDEAGTGWVRQNPKGRQAKSKARIARFEELNSQEHQTRTRRRRSSSRSASVSATKSSNSTA